MCSVYILCCLTLLRVSYQELLESLSEQDPGVKSLKDNVSSLMGQVDERSPDAVRVKQDVNEVGNRYDDVVAKLNDRKARLEEDIANAKEFNDALKDLNDWLPDIQERVAKQQPISTEPETVKSQLEEVQVKIWRKVKKIGFSFDWYFWSIVVVDVEFVIIYSVLCLCARCEGVSNI